MRTERSFLDEIKHQYKVGGMHIRLIFLNVLIFLIIGVLTMGERLANASGTTVTDTLMDIFALRTSFGELIYKPWGLITSIFSHFSLIHCLMNMVFLYSAGSIFLQFFTGRRLLHVYVIAGLTGGLVEIMAHLLFPVYAAQHGIVVGASGSIMGIMMAIVAHKPGLQVNVFGMFQLPFFVIAILFAISDLVSLGMNDGVAHFAHLGGAVIGFLSSVNVHASSNIINMSETFAQRFLSFFGKLLRPQPRMRVERGGVRHGKSDEEYNMEAKERQKKIDAILDKISKSGYESLTKAEKEFLFSQSKNG